MNKKKLIVILSSISILIVLTGAILLIALLGKNDIDKCNSQIKKSIESVTEVSLVITVSDNDVMVYEYKKDVDFVDNKTNITTETTSLNTSFDYDISSDQKTLEEINRQEIFQLGLKKELVDDYTYENNCLTCTISKDTIATLLGNNGIVASSDAKFIFEFDNKRIMKIQCTYKTESEKDVTISAKYSY